MAIPEEAVEAGWKRILSPGHVWVSRLNSPVLMRKTFASGKLAAIAVMTFATLAAIFFSRDWLEREYEILLQPSAVGAPRNAARPANAIDFQAMLVGALSDSKAPLADAASFSSDLVKSVITPLADGHMDEVSAQPWPATGHAWPVDAVVYRKVADDVMFIGARLKSPPFMMNFQAGAIWIGVAHRVGGKWVVYNFTPDRYFGPQLVALPRLQSVRESMIPRATAALVK